MTRCSWWSGASHHTQCAVVPPPHSPLRPFSYSHLFAYLHYMSSFPSELLFSFLFLVVGFALMLRPSTTAAQFIAGNCVCVVGYSLGISSVVAVFVMVLPPTQKVVVSFLQFVYSNVFRYFYPIGSQPARVSHAFAHRCWSHFCITPSAVTPMSWPRPQLLFFFLSSVRALAPSVRCV